MCTNHHSYNGVTLSFGQPRFSVFMLLLLRNICQFSYPTLLQSNKFVIQCMLRYRTIMIFNIIYQAVFYIAVQFIYENKLWNCVPKLTPLFLVIDLVKLITDVGGTGEIDWETWSKAAQTCGYSKQILQFESIQL